MDWAVVFSEIVLRLVYSLSLLGFIFLFAHSYLKKQELFILRCVVSAIVICILMSSLSLISTFILSRKEINYDLTWSLVSRSFLDFSMLLLCMSFLEICFECEPLALLFTTVAGFNSYMLAYGAFLIASIGVLSGFNVNVYDITNLSNIILVVMYLSIYIVIQLVVYFSFNYKRGFDPNSFKNKFIASIFAIDIVSTIVLFNVFLLNINNNNKATSISAFCTVVLLALTFLILQIYIIQNKKIQQEKEEAEQRIALEAKNYRFSKDVLELINIKIHDLKHQIASIEESGKLDKGAFDSLKQTATLYDSIVRTSNETLNTILTEKKIFCEKHRITFTNIIDGDCLNFMKTDELYSLIGNAVDNAIEASMKLPYEKRIIGFKLTTRLGMAILEVRNNYEGEIIFKDGFPKTTKADKDNHGYGTRSLAYIAKKYDGTVSFEANDGVFTMQAMIPLPNN